MSKWSGGIYHKPDLETIMMAIAFLMSQRSIDPRTVHGCVLTSNAKRILSTGYNGPISGSNDKNIPLDDNKYFYFIHAEENCILNYNGSHSDLKEASVYITGKPCHRCLRMLLQKGIKRIIHGHVKSKCLDEIDEKVCKKFIEEHNASVVEYTSIDKVIRVLERTIDYINYKAE
ncbi:MAG: deaminase [Candidatus Woesearchaeota archaeon]|jgi:dCMP deaminase